MAEFGKTIGDAYAFEGEWLDLGRGVHDGKVVEEAAVRLPLATSNRHGLIAGATGTGKTRTLQLLAEQLSAAGIPVVAADMKGDLSGVSQPGDPGGPAEKRAAELGQEWEPQGFPTEFLALGGIGPGVPVRATVSDFGPLLLAKILEANETQEGSLSLVFRYADEKGLPILDLADLRALLSFLDSDEGKADLKGIGGVSSATNGVLLRKLGQLEDGGGTEVLAELFEQLPEVGDVPKPKLVFFFDEAHLLFADATDAFLDAVVQTVRLIRSKGVGVFFITQTPKDIPADVLAQLGNRIQHALRAFTPQDVKALNASVSTYPTSEFYDLEELLTQLGTGEAVVTILSEKGVATPVVHTRLPGPLAQMVPADDVAGAAKASPLFAKYGVKTDRESAKELLAARMEQSSEPEPEPAPAPRRRRAEPKQTGDPLTDFLGSRQGQTIQREVIRGVFGMLRKRM